MISTTATAKLCASLCGALAVSALLLTSAASLRAQDPDHVKQLLSTRECKNCDLRNAQIVRENLNRSDVSGADFTGAFLYGTSFRNANLKNARFTNADLTGADLTGARDANLAGAKTNEHTKCADGRRGPCN